MMIKCNLCRLLPRVAMGLLFFIVVAFFLFDGKPPVIYIRGLNVISISIILLFLEMLFVILIVIYGLSCQPQKNKVKNAINSDMTQNNTPTIDTSLLPMASKNSQSKSDR